MAATDPILSMQVSDRDVVDRLKRLERKTRDLRPAFKNIGEVVLLSTDIRWEREVDPYGTPWLPNSPRTIAIKRAQGRIQKILQSSGRARNEINYEVYRDKVTIGTPLIYMRKHQLGLEGMKKREFLGFTESDRIESIGIIEEFLLEP